MRINQQTTGNGFSGEIMRTVRSKDIAGESFREALNEVIKGYAAQIAKDVAAALGVDVQPVKWRVRVTGLSKTRLSAGLIGAKIWVGTNPLPVVASVNVNKFIGRSPGKAVNRAGAALNVSRGSFQKDIYGRAGVYTRTGKGKNLTGRWNGKVLKGRFPVNELHMSMKEEVQVAMLKLLNSTDFIDDVSRRFGDKLQAL